MQTATEEDMGDYSLNEHFTEKINGKTLVTTRHGSWCVLENGEYDLLLKRNLSEGGMLFKKLENAGVILTKRNIPEVVGKYSQQYSFLGFGKMMYALSFGRTCNLSCAYCHANSSTLNAENKGKKIGRKTMEHILEFIYSAPFQDVAIQFQGGEPLIQFEEIKYFLERLYPAMHVRKKNVEAVEIVTNLTMMDEEIAEYVLEKKIGICTSLDGPRELHDEQRKYFDGRGSYKDVIFWIEYFQKKGRQFSMLPTMTSNSMKYGAKKIIDEYVKWKCKSILFKPVISIGRAKKESTLGLSADEFFNFWREGIEYLVELNKKGVIMYDRYAQSMIRNILLPYKTYMCARRPCGAAISQLAFTENGDIFSCDFDRSMPAKAIGNAGKDAFGDIVLKTIALRTLTQEFQPLCDTCVFGPYCQNCVSRNHSIYNDIVPHKPNDFNCRLTKMTLSYLFEKMQDEEYRKIFTKWVWLNG